MAIKSPLIDERVMEKLFEEFLVRARFYLPQWNPNHETDAGIAVARIFFEMLDKIRVRLNQMPEKSIVKFFDSLGIDLLPAQSAKTWVSFTAIPEAPTIAIVAAGSEISGKGINIDGKETDVPFQTLKDLAVSPAKLKNLISVRSASDQIFSFTFIEKDNGEIKPFSGINLQEHSFYIAHPDLFNLAQNAFFTIEFLLNSGVQKDILEKNEKSWFIWEYYNDTYGTWIELGDTDSDGTNGLVNNGIMVINKFYKGEINEYIIDGMKNRWIRCRVLKNLTSAKSKSLPEITSLKISVKSDKIGPEMAFNNNLPLDIGIKTVRLLGIDVGDIWLWSGSISTGGNNLAIISLPSVRSKDIVKNDRIQLEDGSQWEITEGIIDDNVNVKLAVFLLEKTIPKDFEPVSLNFSSNTIEQNANNYSVQWLSFNYTTKVIAVKISNLPTSKPESITFERKEKKTVSSNLMEPIVINIATDITSGCSVYSLKKLLGTRDISSYAIGTSIRLITAIRKGKVSEVPISVMVDDKTDLPQSRFLYFDPPEESDVEFFLKFKVTSISKKGERVDISLLDINGETAYPDSKQEGDNLYLVSHIKPFGEIPFTGDIFYLACDEAFSKKNATITVSFSYKLNAFPTAPGNPNPPEKNEAKKSHNTLATTAKSFDNQKTIKQDKTDKIFIPPILIWEYWSGAAKTWRRLNTIDTTIGFTKEGSDWSTGELRFTCPEEIAKFKVNGEEKLWIRARIIEGDYGKPTIVLPETFTITETIETDNKKYTYNNPNLQKADVHYPIIRNISITYETRKEYPSTCLCLNNAAYSVITNMTNQENRPFHPFEELPEKRDALFFRFDKQLTGGPLRIYFHLKKEFRDLNKLESVWYYRKGDSWEKFTVDDTTGGFRMHGYVEFFGKQDFTETTLFNLSGYWLKVSLPNGNFPEDLIFDGIYINAVEAIQSSLINDEQLGASDGTVDQTFLTIKSPIIDQCVWVREPSQPDENAIQRIKKDEPDNPLIKVTDNSPWSGEYWIRWHCVEDFDNTGPDDRHYRVDHRTGTICFGNGKKGMVPPKGAANIKISYRFGGGIAGNAQAGAISSVKTSIPYINKVINPFRADGGAESETTETALIRGAQTLQHRNRAVTAEDFERITLLSRAVARARCLPNIDDEGEPNPGWISVLIIPRTDEKPPIASMQLISNINDSLQKACVGTVAADNRLAIRSPRFITIRVKAILIPKTADSSASIVNDAVNALDYFFDPISGGLNKTGWEFGGTVFYSSIVAILEGIKNVEYMLECQVYADDVCYNDDILIPFDAVTIPGDHSIDLVLREDQSIDSLVFSQCDESETCL